MPKILVYKCVNYHLNAHFTDLDTQNTWYNCIKPKKLQGYFIFEEKNAFGELLMRQCEDTA